jgi:uncharacterized protein (DUF1697 family)
MADLRALCQGLGLSEVKTYIQSGNVVYRAPLEENESVDASCKRLSAQITEAILQKYGFNVPTLTLTTDMMDALIRENPMLREEGIDIEKLHVTFLDTVPLEANIAKVVDGWPLVVGRKGDIPTNNQRPTTNEFDDQPAMFANRQSVEQQTTNDCAIIHNKQIYIYCPDGYGNTKINNNFFESKLKVAATTRNWKTVRELMKMGCEL